MVDVANAQTAAAATNMAGAHAFLADNGLLFVMMIIFGLFYFLILQPQKKEQKKREEAITAIQRGDRILTRGGVYGTVADIKEQILIVKIAENVKIEMDRSFVESVIKG